MGTPEKKIFFGVIHWVAYDGTAENGIPGIKYFQERLHPDICGSMEPGTYESGAISLVLSWISTLAVLLWAVVFLVASISESAKSTPTWVLVWTVLCVLALTPFRYLVFELSLIASFPFQSWGALGQSFLLTFYAPWAFGAMAAAVVLLPMSFVFKIASENPTPSRTMAAAVAAPVLCVISAFLFIGVLNPLFGWSIGWVNQRDLVRATNGPSRFLFDYVASPFSPIQFPFYFDMTRKTDVDAIRCHVAGRYLSESGEFEFVEATYPEIIDEVVRSGR